jgi:hypothetical protein
MTEELIIDAVVTQICESGCKHVYLCIEKIKRSTSFSEIENLTPKQSQQVLIELEAIMLVYDGKLCKA